MFASPGQRPVHMRLVFREAEPQRKHSQVELGNETKMRQNVVFRYKNFTMRGFVKS
jgi:hypothetical protein